MDFEDARKAIQENEIFAGIRENHLGLLLTKARVRQFAKGQSVFVKGQGEAKTFCLIVSGTMNILKDNGQVLRTLCRPEIIGEIGPISPQHQRTCDVTAGENAEVLEWKMDDITPEIADLEKKLKALAWERIVDSDSG